MNLNDTLALWAPRVLSILRIICRILDFIRRTMSGRVAFSPD